MNWKRGLFRLWLVGSIVWLGAGIYLWGNDLTARKEHIQPGAEYSDDCVFGRASCPKLPLAPDWHTRQTAIFAVIAPPVAVPILGFALFWAGWLGLKVAEWIVRGFRVQEAVPVAKHQSETGMPYPPEPSLLASRLKAGAIFAFAPMLLGLVIALLIFIWQTIEAMIQ